MSDVTDRRLPKILSEEELRDLKSNFNRRWFIWNHEPDSKDGLKLLAHIKAQDEIIKALRRKDNCPQTPLFP